MKKKVLICITAQFGYHTPTTMYCKYLNKEKFEVHYVGFDFGFEKKSIKDVNVHYIELHNKKIKRYWTYVNKINQLIKKEDFDVLFLVDCQGSLLLRLSNLFRKSVLDIRTGDVRLGNSMFSLFNLKILLSSVLFKNITILSNNLQELLKLPKHKCHLIPLGAEQLSLKDKEFTKLKLFYIGVLQERNIFQTIEGLSLFIKKNENIIVEYNIVGYGQPNDEQRIIDYINKFELGHIVKFHGKKFHHELQELFDESNIGLVYVPITKGYNNQPATKLYEYCLAGMAVIATETIENKLTVLPTTGVLIEDTPISFANGLEEFLKNRHNYNSKNIRNLYSESRWDVIVSKRLDPYLENL